MSLDCFKAYDIRGRMPDQLNDGIVASIAQAFAEHLKPKSAVMGADVRPDSPRFKLIFAQVLEEFGCQIIDLGQCGTEEVYFHTADQDADLGIMVTASHNPIEYNGIKFVGKGATPFTDTSQVAAISARAAELAAENKGHFDLKAVDRPALAKTAYINKLLSFVDLQALKPLKLVITSGNGAAGPVVDFLEHKLPFEMVKIHHEPDASFPNGIPNPLLPERRSATSQAVIDHQADFGIAFDGDFDRCFFFDHLGRFVEGYYLVGLIAKAMLKTQSEPQRIVYDARMTWATEDAVLAAGSLPIISRTGHSFIKQIMRENDALYGGEMSAHHYFRDFAYCDTGMVPWLVIAELVSHTGESLASLVDDAQQAFPCSGEINFNVSNADAAVQALIAQFGQGGQQVTVDGISCEFSNWRFNVRKSNTEPLLRLNIETRGDKDLLKEKTKILAEFLAEQDRPAN